MIALSAADSAGTLAHGIHYALVAGGLVGLTVLLAPTTLASRRRAGAPHDEHERRIRRLRDELLAHRFAAAPVTSVAPAPASAPVPAPPRLPASAAGDASYALLPLGVVSSAAAAGVHAAVCPGHFREGALLGVFFAVTALAQLVWAGLLLRGSSRPLLAVGLAGNLALLTLWTATRTTGLPWGLIPGPEEAGPWDLTACAWELVVAGVCFQLLHDGRVPSRVGGWSGWHPVAHVFFATSVVALGLLTISGAGA